MRSILIHAANDVLCRNTWLSMQVTGMRMHQRPARTDISRPRNGHGPVFNEIAYVVRAAPIVARKADVAAAVECLDERALGFRIEVHFGRLSFGNTGDGKYAILRIVRV